MKIVTVTVTRGITVNTGNYENEKIEVSYSLDLSDTDDAEKQRNKIFKELGKFLRKEKTKILTDGDS